MAVRSVAAPPIGHGGAGAILGNRWVILLFSVISMVAVANLQYGWTLFVPPLSRQLGQDVSLIQVAFTVFVLLETWLVPFEGILVDRFGPRLLVMIGGVLAGLGWVGSGYATTLTSLYLAYAVAGLGAGIVYGTAIGSALKWFPDHRGLAAGLTAAGFGAGAALTVAPIANMIDSAGYQAAFIQWGIIQGAVVLVAALFLSAPAPGWVPAGWDRAVEKLAATRRQSGRDFTPPQMARTPQFWIMYLMMTMVATGGLMATAQLNPMATDFGVDKIPVTFLWIALPALQFALAADRIVNGLCRPFWGWISDHIGRELTMTIAFGLEALAIFGLISSAKDPVLFVLFSAFTFFGWGEIYSLMPATSGDFFGRKHATTNYGFLYTAKGTASVFVPIGSALAAGKQFDFRADILLLVGGVIVFLTLFLGPTLLRITFGPGVRGALYAAGAVLILYGLVLTVIPDVWTPFSAKFNVPHIGWAGVFAIAAIFDVCAAVMAYFILRRMRVPDGGEEPTTSEETQLVSRPVTAVAAH
jgi:OFA family oxalate/formate antiporter-like MFS transporter